MTTSKINFLPQNQLKKHNVATEVFPEDLMPEKGIIDENSIKLKVKHDSKFS